MKVVVYPVPRGYTPDQAYDELEVFGTFHGYRWYKPRFWFPHYSTVMVDD